MLARRKIFRLFERHSKIPRPENFTCESCRLQQLWINGSTPLFENGTSTSAGVLKPDFASIRSSTSTPESSRSRSRKEIFLHFKEAVDKVPWYVDADLAVADDPNLKKAQRRLGYKFKNIGLFKLALLHKSYQIQSPVEENNLTNKKLSWLGDAALYMIVTEQLLSAFPDAPLESVSDERRRMISRESCTRLGERLGLAETIVFGKCHLGEASHNMIAECFEAVLGAIYVDAGFLGVSRFLMKVNPIPESI